MTETEKRLVEEAKGYVGEFRKLVEEGCEDLPVYRMMVCIGGVIDYIEYHKDEDAFYLKASFGKGDVLDVGGGFCLSEETEIRKLRIA